MIYIHYGTDNFSPEYFTPVRNSEWDKPRGGLWGSIDGSWESWCRENRFHLDELNTSFTFSLPDARVLILESPDQLLSLPLLKPWKPKVPPEVEEGEIPSMEQLREWFAPNPCFIDFEKLAEEYDAIELRNSIAKKKRRSCIDCMGYVNILGGKEYRCGLGFMVEEDLETMNGGLFLNVHPVNDECEIITPPNTVDEFVNVAASRGIEWDAEDVVTVEEFNSSLW